MKKMTLLSIVLAGSIATGIATSAFAQNSLRWINHEELANSDRNPIELLEEDSMSNVRFAYANLRQNSNRSYLLVFNENSNWCGSGGCKFEILEMRDGRYEHLTGFPAGGNPEPAGITLGKGYTRGMRNLRQNNRVTLIWNGSEYVVK